MDNYRITSDGEDLMTVSELNDELQIMGTEDPRDLPRLLKAAREYVEQDTERVLVDEREYVMWFSDWPDDGWRIRWRPLIRIDRIDYYDVSDVDTQLTFASFFRLQLSHVQSRLYQIANTILPSLYDREDAVRITLTAGQGVGAELAEMDRRAIVARAMADFEFDGSREAEAMSVAADRVSMRRWVGGYA